MTYRDITGRQVDGYQLEAVIGRGTVGEVYRALTANHEPVAIKLCIPPANSDIEVILTRFNREARTVARLHHPHIVPALDTGTVEGQAYMVMPLIEGDSLADLLQRQHRFDEMTTIEIGWQVAD
ncbi:MAG: protein kinase, partial [Anaerolineae bacterium]|nr:protein kinase [Anaerolineae bacterium]